jgi:hypothetical protein
MTANPFTAVKKTKTATPTKSDHIPDLTKKVPAARQNFDYVPVVKVDFEPRAGLQTYTRELQERLNDAAEKGGVHEVYEVAVRMKPRVYKALLECTLRRNEATQSPDWNEQDHLEAWMKLMLEDELQKMVGSP